MPAFRFVTNAKAVSKAFNMIDKEVLAMSRFALREAGIWAQRRVVREINVRRKQASFSGKSGTLARAVAFKVSQVPSGTKLEFGVLKSKGGKPIPVYAGVRLLKGATVIKPKNKPFLAWQDPETKEWIYTRKPVTQYGWGILEPVFKDLPPRVLSELDQAAADRIQKRLDKLIPGGNPK